MKKQKKEKTEHIIIYSETKTFLDNEGRKNESYAEILRRILNK